MRCSALILLKNNDAIKRREMTEIIKYRIRAKLMFLLILLVNISINLFSQSHAKKDITGFWYTPEKDCKVEIYYIDGKLNGRFVWFKDPNDENGNPVTDTNNPDENLRKLPLMKRVFLSGFIPAKKENKWKGGKIYNPRDGHTYKAEISFPGGDTLVVRGYFGISLLGKNSVWTRVPEELTIKK
jgi:uncharacterized protein (DUF2147 family)